MVVVTHERGRPVLVWKERLTVEGVEQRVAVRQHDATSGTHQTGERGDRLIEIGEVRESERAHDEVKRRIGQVAVMVITE